MIKAELNVGTNAQNPGKSDYSFNIQIVVKIEIMLIKDKILLII
jgi:hypothetical protein